LKKLTLAEKYRLNNPVFVAAIDDEGKEKHEKRRTNVFI
jgi:hypothetical protein